MTACIDHRQAGDKDGYARIRVGGRRVVLHRKVYADAHQVPLQSLDGLVVRHKCDNPRCINADHLVVGTHQDNMDDKVARGRQYKGPSHHSARLTDEDVEYIRAVYVPRHAEYGGAALARMFGVSSRAINKVVLCQTRN